MASYDEILSTMKRKYKSVTGLEPDYASDLGIRFSVLSGELLTIQAEVEFLKAQMFPSTASGEYLDLHARQRGLSRKTGKKAKGEIILGVTAALGYNIEIPEGTVCATRGDDPVRVATTEAAVLSAGNTAVAIPVEAISEGASGNVKPRAICDMVTPISGIDRVLNYLALSGGSDPENDEQLRARIIDSFVNLSNGTNKAFYIKSAMEVEGVTAAGVIPRNRGSGTVDVFITDAAKNPSEELIAEVQAKLDELREINVDVKVKALTINPVDVFADITVKRGYDSETVIANCKAAIKLYFDYLAAGETMYLSDLGEYIQHVDGVKNYTYKDLVMYNIPAKPNGLLTCKTINLTWSEE